MKENYWIHHSLDREKIATPFYDFYKDKIRVLSEREFNFRINYTRLTGLRNIFAGLSLLTLTHLSQGIDKDAENSQTFDTICYIAGALGAASGAKRTFDYFKHKNDVRPTSEEEAFYKYIIDDKDEKQ